jgi:hypothetical protein
MDANWTVHLVKLPRVPAVGCGEGLIATVGMLRSSPRIYERFG